MTNAIKAAFFILLLVLTALPAQAAEPLVKIRLVPERGLVKPGEEIWVGIEQSIETGWHTYWKNPGDSGTAPRVAWKLPKGFEIGDIHWPVPHKLSIGPLMNYGYENNVILLQKLKAPANIDAGPLALKADIEILVCKEECIPEYGSYEIILNGPEGEQENNEPYLKKALAKLPSRTEWPVSFSEAKKQFSLSFDIRKVPRNLNYAKVEFFPEDWGIVHNPAKPVFYVEKNIFTLTQERDTRPLAGFDAIKGLLVFGEDSSRQSFAVKAQKKSLLPPNMVPTAPLRHTPVFQALLFALLGGIILNLMPCVFPVLSIKALSLVKVSGKNAGRAPLYGLAYTAGVISSFLVIAGILIFFRAAGSEIGWGFQLQNTMVVTLLAWLLFVIGLNLAGLFEISGHFGNFGNKLAQGEGLRNSFFTGVLATLVATPCTAPFMGVAIGVALLQPPHISLTIFAALGLGLALPYLVLSFAPTLQKALPRPGAWMDIFKQLLAFPMFASSAWLIWVLSQQAGSMGVFGALMGLVFIAFGIWLLGHMPKSKYWRYKVRLLAIASFVIACFQLPAAQMEVSKIEGQQEQAGSFGQAYSPEKLGKLLEGDNPVFVEMTAAWCITCKVNHAVAIDREGTRKVFADNNVQYLIGDWTNQDAHITEYLNSFGRNGVPLYVFYGKRDAQTKERPEPSLLPQILTPGIVETAVTKK